MTVIVERQMLNGMVGVTYPDGVAELLVAGLSSVPIQRLDAATLEPRSEPFTFLTGFLAFPYASAESDEVAIVTSDVGAPFGSRRPARGSSRASRRTATP